MDIYLEQSSILSEENINKKTKVALTVIKFVMLALSIFGLLFFFLTLVDGEGNFAHPIWIALSASAPIFFFISFLFFRKKSLSLNLEFDYVINGNRFWIYKIINRQKRKPFIDLDILKFDEIGTVDMPNLNRHLHGAKEYVACANFEDTNNYVLTRVKGEKAIVYLELEPDTITAINRTIGRNIVVRNK